MIIRSNRKTRFTIISNDLIEDSALDWKALGMLIYLLSKPDTWEISVAHLVKERKTGRDGVYAILKSLVDAGYASKKPRPEGGWDWIVYDEKCNQHTENPTDPNRENPYTENPIQVNTEYIVNTEEYICEEKQRGKSKLKLLDEFGITGQLAKDFIEHRRTKKAAITKTVMERFRNEANKANIDLAEAIRISMERNWQGFKADFLQQKRTHGGNNYDRKSKGISEEEWWSTDF